MHIEKLSCVLSLFLFSGLAHAATIELSGGNKTDSQSTSIWSWVDASGQTVFSDRPPKKGEGRGEVKKIAQPSVVDSYVGEPASKNKPVAGTAPLLPPVINLPPLPSGLPVNSPLPPPK